MRLIIGDPMRVRSRQTHLRRVAPKFDTARRRRTTSRISRLRSLPFFPKDRLSSADGELRAHERKLRWAGDGVQVVDEAVAGLHLQDADQLLVAEGHQAGMTVHRL